MKRQSIRHTYGDDEDDEIIDSTEREKHTQEGIAAGIAKGPVIPSTLSPPSAQVDVEIGGRGCRKCGSMSHQRSSHRDCPYNKKGRDPHSR